MINNNNNNLQHISKGLDEVLTDMLVRCMLNPDNKDFYIGTMTLGQVAKYFAEMPTADESVATVFWSAYSRAEAQYLEEQRLTQEYDKSCELDDIACEYAKHGNNSYYGAICPECGCTEALGYVDGVACPNCDSVKGV